MSFSDVLLDVYPSLDDTPWDTVHNLETAEFVGSTFDGLYHPRPKGVRLISGINKLDGILGKIKDELDMDR